MPLIYNNTVRPYHLKLLLSILFSAFIASLYIVVFPLKPFLPYVNYLLGIDEPTTYLILLQNDKEIRANGGFAGSYAKITMNFPKYEVTFQDIYVPNGQLKGHVTPPQPIQDSFKHGTWELANADYEPDFTEAATSIRWFFDKGGEKDPDILGTINLSTIHDILRIVGPFKVTDYDAEITADNFYYFLQGKAETNFFPGSTQKKDALTSVGKALKNKLHQLTPLQLTKIAQIVYRDLKRSNILVNSRNPDFQQAMVSNKYAGQITPGPYDSFMLTELNLGANKANCCIERLTTHTISTDDNNTFLHRVHTTISNLSTEYSPNPPFNYSGHYIAYIRLYLPNNAVNVNIIPFSALPPISGDFGLPDNVTTKEKFGLKEIGFFLITAAGSQSTIDLSYELKESPTNHYRLDILKQHGLISSPQNVIYNGRSHQTDLLTDYVFQIP